ncbi:hypothetical protein [Methanobrevibacter sp.]|uniref:hypothetical protein n=1 Tax=Methanobrevibacter sp. TaxID=66852 RepID=UPI0038696A8F
MSSRSATVLVIFIVAVLAFCFASVFASMTGPISILPNESESGGILDNLSAITDDNSNDNSYDYQDYNYYSEDDSSDNQVETTTDDSSSNSDSHQSSSDSSSSESSSDSSSEVETTTDDSHSDSGSGSSSKVETTTG